jgi:hypothetical protein
VSGKARGLGLAGPLRGVGLMAFAGEKGRKKEKKEKGSWAD